MQSESRPLAGQLQRCKGQPVLTLTRRLVTAFLLSALLSGCSLFAPPSKQTVPSRENVLEQARRILADAARFAIPGRVTWPGSSIAPDGDFSVQALPSSVVNQSTLSLIEYATGVTVATNLSNSDGTFILSLGTYVPAPTAYFILEAIKGLNAQLPGFNAARMRTILQWNGSAWVSCTNTVPTPVGLIGIHQLTTALAIELGLARVAAADVIGKSDLANPPGLTATPIGPVAGSEVLALSTDVKQFVVNNQDPVTETGAVLPSVTAVTPTTGTAGTVVAIDGAGFVKIPSATTVNFTGSSGDVPAPILLVTNKKVYAQVPNGAVTGNLTIVTTRGPSNVTAFTVPAGSTVTISSLGPNPISPGSNISLTGTGYVTPATANTVALPKKGGGTTNGTVVSGDTNSLAVTVPQDAESGVVRVSNTNGQSNGVFLNVSVTGFPIINEVFPNKGAANQDVMLNGLLFGAQAGTVTINGYSAQIRQWRDDQVRVRVPWQVTAGPATITMVNSSLQGASVAWTALAGDVQYGSFLQVGTLTLQSGVQIIPVFSGKNLYFVGGGTCGIDGCGSNNIARLTLNADGGAGVLTQSVGTVPVNIGSPDGHGHADTWLGDRYWVFTNNSGSGKAYMEFDSQGNYKASRISGPAFNLLNGVAFYQHDSAITGGPKGIYIAGSDTAASAAYANCVYSLYDPFFNTISPWQSIALPGGGLTNHEDNVGIVLQNNLWVFGYDSLNNGHQMVTPLDQDGKPTGFRYAGTVPPRGVAAQHTSGNVTAIGSYLWIFDGYCCGGSTAVWRTNLVAGTYPQNYNTGWPSFTANLAFAGTAEAMVAGGWVYVVGGYPADNRILAAPIL